MFGAHMPISYWGEVITVVAYLINHVPYSSLKFRTPFDVHYNIVSASTIPNLFLKVFMCVAFEHLHKPLRNKLQPHAFECVFVGYTLY
jgi:hypothetical protein